MECPICGSNSNTILKSKEISSKKSLINEYLLKCNDCSYVFKNRKVQSNPNTYRIIISENEKSIKTTIDLFPDEVLKVDDGLLSQRGQVKVTGIEVDGKRVKKSIIRDISTIWASSIEIPARFGLSVDLSGKVQSYKIEVERDFIISTKDLIKIEDYIIRVHIIKTLERKTTSGYAKADVIKRVYGRPVQFKRYDYDLTDKIYKKTVKLPKHKNNAKSTSN